MKKLSEKMVERAIDAIIDVTDRLPNGNQELAKALEVLNRLRNSLTS